MSAPLAARVEGDPRAPHGVVVLHGILGSERNWRSFARALVRARPDLRVLAPDLRGHGASSAGEPPHTIDACVDDLRAWLDDEGESPVAVVGHSFGGKVALQLGAVLPSVQQVWVLDADPRPHLRDGGSGVTRVLRALRSQPMPVQRREEALVGLQDLGESVVAWMSTNLRRDECGYHWRFRLEVVEALLEDYGRRDARAQVRVMGRGVHFVWGERGVLPLGPQLSELATARHHTLAGAGHWLHADRPEALLGLLSEHLPRG